MKIGMCDLDFLNPRVTPFPNLEMMKLATYFQKRNNVVTFESNWHNNEDYDVFYIFSDKDPSSSGSMIKKNISKLKQDNIRYQGLFFNYNKWIPLDEEIEKSLPNFDIYNAPLRERIINNKVCNDTVSQLYRNKTYLRYYYDEWNYRFPYPENKKIVLYETDLTSHADWRETVQEMHIKSGAKLLFKYPIIIRNPDDFRFTVEVDYRDRHNKAPEFIIDVDEAYSDPFTFFKEYQPYLSQIRKQRLNYYLGRVRDDEDYLLNALNCYEVLLYCHANDIQLKFHMWEDKLNPYYFILKQMKSMYLFPTGSLYENLEYRISTHPARKQELLDFLEEVRQKYPIMHEWFYIPVQDITNHKVELNYGSWRN